MDAQPDFTDGKRRPWVSELDTEKGAPVSPVHFHRGAIFRHGGYALFVWLAVAMTVALLALLALHTVPLCCRAILRGAQQRREARMRAAQAQQECGVNLRRKTGYGWSARCWRAWG